jgi:hypothetical protein
MFLIKERKLSDTDLIDYIERKKCSIVTLVNEYPGLPSEIYDPYSDIYDPYAAGYGHIYKLTVNGLDYRGNLRAILITAIKQEMGEDIESFPCVPAESIDVFDFYLINTFIALGCHAVFQEDQKKWRYWELGGSTPIMNEKFRGLVLSAANRDFTERMDVDGYYLPFSTPDK